MTCLGDRMSAVREDRDGLAVLLHGSRARCGAGRGSDSDAREGCLEVVARGS